jgi:hypothetical protein
MGLCHSCKQTRQQTGPLLSPFPLNADLLSRCVSVRLDLLVSLVSLLSHSRLFLCERTLASLTLPHASNAYSVAQTSRRVLPVQQLKDQLAQHVHRGPSCSLNEECSGEGPGITWDDLQETILVRG